MSWVFMGLGIVLLFGGGESLVRGAVALASRLGISPLVIGLTIVGFGTSAPELVVSISAALDGAPDLAVGNVVGSNTANILLILGTAAVISPLAVHEQVIRRDGVIMLAASAVLVVLAVGFGAIDRVSGGILVAALVLFVGNAYVSGKRDSAARRAYAAEADEVADIPLGPALATAAMAVGLLLLVGGAELLVRGASEVARGFGVSEAVIGLTVVAVGTSLPELATSVVAALRRHADVAVGNVVGSNIFNIFGILGTTALVRPLPIADRIAAVDVWVMAAVAVVALVALRTGWRLDRVEGVVFVVAYCGYTAWLAVAGG